MDFLQEFYLEMVLAFLPWLVFFLMGLAAAKLLSWARGRKGGAIVFGVLVQMFLPDPYVERTIETVTVERKAMKRQNENGEPLLKED